jgi:hypothetical protein
MIVFLSCIIHVIIFYFCCFISFMILSVSKDIVYRIISFIIHLEENLLLLKPHLYKYAARSTIRTCRQDVFEYSCD